MINGAELRGANFVIPTPSAEHVGSQALEVISAAGHKCETCATGTWLIAVRGHCLCRVCASVIGKAADLGGVINGIRSCG